MNHDLFALSIEAASAAYGLGNQRDFTIAVRVAQSTLENKRALKMLDFAVCHFNSPRIPDMLQRAANYLLLQSQAEVAQQLDACRAFTAL